MVVTTIAERYGIPHSTICSWLDRLENQPIADALRGELRPGLPPKLTPSHRVDTWLDGTPRAVGHGEAELAAERLHVRIQDVFDIEYSEAHIHRLFVT